MTNATTAWKLAMANVYNNYKYQSAPRGMGIREILNFKYEVDMHEPIVLLGARKLNYGFMFAEAAWIVSGSNRLEDITPYMKSYANYSDDGFTLHGAYGPKFIDQISYVAKAIAKDLDTRQAVMNIWREKPGESKDIPCTTNIQWLVRDKKLHCVVTMRSQDIILGTPYDIFTFTCMTKYLQLLLWEHYSTAVELGSLSVNVGSAHIYDKHLEDVDAWLSHYHQLESPLQNWRILCKRASTPTAFVEGLRRAADDYN